MHRSSRRERPGPLSRPGPVEVPDQNEFPVRVARQYLRTTPPSLRDAQAKAGEKKEKCRFSWQGRRRGGGFGTAGETEGSKAEGAKAGGFKLAWFLQGKKGTEEGPGGGSKDTRVR
jgi:hypothetical protein